MSLQCGIVGLPNVGKSTLFNALTAAKAESANYPFCTIDPNVGIVNVPDARLEKITKLVEPQSIVPTSMEFVDIAGLVEGASKGEGLGNQFLANIRQTNAIIHVVRCFEDSNIIHVSGSIDPIRDIEVINTELMLADLESIEKKLQKTEKLARATNDAQLKLEASVIKKIHKALSDGKPARSVEFNKDDIGIAQELNLLTIKPVLYACNVGEDDFASSQPDESNSFVKKVNEYAKKEGNLCISICSSLESEISQLNDSEKEEFLKELGSSEPGLNRLIRESYQLLNLITFFTAGKQEVRAWTIKENYLAPQAAGVIHTDFEKGFIRAETYHCEDLFELKTEGAIKEAGKYRSEGKSYKVKDGDVMLFRFNV